ncbi:MAG: hypothetical protein IPP90_06005 [Gemmatimonadaceae bacterium]|nr:hypothetical protein [Gemmatimonadaceae bacterium]
MPTRAEAEYPGRPGDHSRRVGASVRIIDDLFLLARADAASPIHQRERVDIGELLAASVRSVRTIADDQHMRLTLEHAGDNRDAVFVDGDPVLLRRLLLNLLDNALKHTPRDGAISVAFRNTASYVVIVVADSGPGIPPELRPRIFDRFVRGAVDAGRVCRQARVACQRPAAPGWDWPSHAYSPCARRADRPRQHHNGRSVSCYPVARLEQTDSGLTIT